MKNIAVIAHDAKKKDLKEFVESHRDWIVDIHIVGTGRTAEFLEENAVKVEHLSKGRSGGYNQITEMIVKNKIDLVIFFIDPDVKQPHHADIDRLIEHCNRHNVPLATNPISAELIIIGMIKKDQAERVKRRLQ